MRLDSLFKRKEKIEKKDGENERNPLTLDWLTKEDLTARKVANQLKKGKFVVCWFSLLDVQDYFSVYELKDGLIYEYSLIFDLEEPKNNCLKLADVRLETTDSYLDIWEENLSKAIKVYFGEPDRFIEYPILETNLDFAELKKKLKRNEKYVLRTEDFKKK